MPNASQSKFQEQDKSFFIESPIQGIAAVLLKTLRGKYGVNEELMTNWTEFQKHYGGEGVDYPGVTLAKRALMKGAKLRVVKIGHHTTISNPTTLDAVKATINENVDDFAMVDVSNDAFDLIIKYAGADYNNIQVKITAASNGNANSFNLEINHLQEPDLNELYQNLLIIGHPNVQQSHYLDDVISKSKFFDVVYQDLSALSDTMRPTNGTWTMAGGTDGGAIIDTDYIGDTGGTGLHHLSNYDDFDFFAVLDNFTTAVDTAVGAYAASREDSRALIHLPNSNDAVSELITAKSATNIDTRFVMFFGGGLKIANPFITSTDESPYEISELGDVLGVACKSAAEFGPWYSFAGTSRGIITNALGVVNNFAPGGFARLNQLAQRQINVVVSQGGRIYVKGNFSGQLASSRKSFANVVGLIIFIKKSLKPTLDRYLEEPNDFRLFRDLHNDVLPFFESLKGEEKRALIDYDWRGDQTATQDSDLKINNRPDLDQGKYVVQLWLKETVSLQELTINIISAPSGVTFEVQ